MVRHFNRTSPIVSGPFENVKVCRSCSRLRSREDFYGHPKTADGLEPTCRPCRTLRGQDAHLRRKFGITLETYTAMLESQGGVCDICGSPPTTRSLAVDHDHETGAVRGLLCHHCNLGIGNFQERKENFLRAIAYLEKHQC